MSSSLARTVDCSANFFGLALLRISANVTGDFGNVTDLRIGAGLRG